MRTHGSARRSRATWSRSCVSSFSRPSSFLRSVSHCSGDTTGWGVMLDFTILVVMMGSWLVGTPSGANRCARCAALGSLPVSVETGYAIGRDAGSNKIVVIRISDGNSGFQGSLSLTCGLGRVARDEGSELPLERLGCAIAPTVRDPLGCRIREDVLLAA